MRIAPLLLLVLLLVGLTSCQADENWKTAVYATGGVRQLSQSDWSPVESQPMVGLEGVGRDPRGILGVEFGGSFSFAEDSEPLGSTTQEVDGQVFDLYLGPRLTFFEGFFRPFISAGFIWGYAKATSEALGFEIENTSNSVGGYGRAGFDFYFSEHFSVGADARYVFGTHYSADVGESFDTDGLVGAIRIGWSF